MKMPAFEKNIVAISKTLLNAGVDTVDEDNQFYVKQSNINGLLFFTIDTFLALIFYFILDSAHISIGLIISAFLFLITSIGFNLLNLTTLSRFSTASLGSFLTVYCSLYLGSKSFTEACLLIGAIFPFTYFSIKDIKLIILSLFIPVGCYVFVIYHDFQFGPSLNVESPSAIFTLRLVMFLITFFAILVNIYIAVSEREKKTDEIKESQKLLETIFYALSHDLANPIQTINMLADYAKTQEQFTENKIKSLKLSTKQLLRVFTNLKAVVKASINGKLKLNLEILEPLPIIQEAVSFVNDIAQKKGVQIIVNSTSENYKIEIDKDVFIFQIITNFLTNSIKFSEPNQKILITISSENNNALIQIRDWGMGIEADKIKKLFSWNDKTTSVGTNGEKGSGIGLPLAFKFLSSMNGDIKVISYHHSQFSSNDRGTLITLILPIASSNNFTNAKSG